MENDLDLYFDSISNEDWLVSFGDIPFGLATTWIAVSYITQCHIGNKNMPVCMEMYRDLCASCKRSLLEHLCISGSNTCSYGHRQCLL